MSGLLAETDDGELIESFHRDSNNQEPQEEIVENGEHDVLGMFGWKFESREELISTLKEVFSMQRYAISNKHSVKDKFVYFGCDRGGCYRDNWKIPPECRKRKTASHLTNCPFDLRSKRLYDGYWIVELRNGSHNHEPSSDMSGHPSRCRLSKEEILSIEEMTKLGIPPRQILSSLRQRNPILQAVSRTIYNLKAKLHKENLPGRTMIQALLGELHAGDFFYNVLHDNDGHVTHLFFAHPSSIILTRSYSNTFVMDCTYKTNKYKMPLLDIVGISSFNTLFFSCFALLAKEGEEDYVWALKMFRNMLDPNCYPSVIVTDREMALMNAISIVIPMARKFWCVWNIGKNFLTNYKSSFESKDEWEVFLTFWNQVVGSNDEVLFEENWRHFELSYKEKEKVMNYLRRTWLPFKDRFVRAWIDKYPYFGNRASSRAEGAHAKLKRYLQVSTGDLIQVKSSICLKIINEYNEINTQLSSEKIRVLKKCNIPFFKEIVTKVSMFAMGEILKKYDMVKYVTLQSRCTENFNKSMDLPCAHMIMALKGTSLPLDIIHSQWRIDMKSIALAREEVEVDDGFKKLLCDFEDKYKEMPLARKEQIRGTLSQLIMPSPPLLFEPTIQVHKGRPLGSKKKNASSIKGDASNFEIVKATRKCSLCGAVGHNSRTCPKNLRKNDTQVHRFRNGIDVIDLNVAPTSLDFT